MELKILGLSKTYPNGVKALDQVDLTLGKGMFGLLGPNGAGKSSLMRTIATLQYPDQGEIEFDGINILTEPLKLRNALGYLPQDFGVYPGISAEELLSYFANLKGMSSGPERQKLLDYILDVTNLTEVRKRAVSTFSGGMKQRFGIAQLLLNDPKLIIVDEPTAGLDPAERKRFLNILREISQNSIVIFSTHIVDDVKELCNDMGIMNAGRILFRGSPASATTNLNGKVWQCNTSRTELADIEQRYKVISSGYNEDETVKVRVYSEQQPSHVFNEVKPELEDAYFIKLNGLDL